MSVFEPVADIDSANETPESVEVGPFKVVALPQAAVVDKMVRWPVESGPAIMCHLHVGALNERNNSAYVHAMNASAMTYADGMATVLVAKAAGAADIERSGLTDIGHEVIEGVAKHQGRTARVAYLGGPPGLAERAGEALSAAHDCETVVASDGFHDDAGWSEVLRSVRDAKPDIVFVGLGMPREAIWAQKFRSELPPALIMPAGGFFGHVVGDEKRAPEWAQKIGMEWLWRVGQSPTRLASRYAKGIFSTALLAFQAYRKRT